MKNEKGFSLLEVVASLVIITIILLSFYPMFLNAKKISGSNIERLVVINLAEATLNRLKLDKYSFIDRPSVKPDYLYTKKREQVYSLSDCATDECKNNFSINVNNKHYFFYITASQNETEERNGLISIIVTAKNENENITYSVEGYVSFDTEGNSSNAY